LEEICQAEDCTASHCSERLIEHPVANTLRRGAVEDIADGRRDLYTVEDGGDGTGGEQLAFSGVGERAALGQTCLGFKQQLGELGFAVGNEQVVVALVVEVIASVDGLEVGADRVPFW